MSSDGEVILSGARDNTIQSWDTGHKLAGANTVNFIDVSSDEEQVLLELVQSFR